MERKLPEYARGLAWCHNSFQKKTGEEGVGRSTGPNLIQGRGCDGAADGHNLQSH